MLPIVCPLKSIDINRDRIISEVLSLPSDLFFRTANYRPNKIFNPEEFNGWHVGSLEENVNSDYFYHHDSENIYVPGTIQCWRALKLTQIDDEPLSLTQNAKKNANGQWERFRTNEHWSWVESVTKLMPYTVGVIKSLPLYKITNVRVILLDANCLGPAHSDEPLSTYQNNNLTAINLNILNGGSPMKCLTPKGEIDIDYPVYQFTNHYPHGVPVTTSQRLTIQVEGFYNSLIYDSLDFNEAIWP